MFSRNGKGPHPEIPEPGGNEPGGWFVALWIILTALAVVLWYIILGV